MADPIALDLGYETAGRILESVGGRGMGFLAVDLEGEILWRSECEFDLRAMRALQERIANGLPPQGETLDLGERGQLIVKPICKVTDGPLAWLIGCSGDDVADGNVESSREWKRVGETLPRVAEMLTSECKLAAELSGAVAELSDRYEELNVVFRMERESRSLNPQVDVVQAMLEGFLSHLHVEVGVLTTAGLGKNLSARGTSTPIRNLDLVLTELIGKVWRFIEASRKPVVMNELQDERRSYLLTNLPFKLLAIPNDGCDGPDAGLLLLRHADAPDFTNSDMSLARVFFGQAMILLRNQALLGKMERFTRQIASSLVETVEAKDPYTRGHSERVESITAGLGRGADLPADDFQDLLWGALLHDIGKIGVPDAILMKPGRLNADEFNFIKTHPTRSYEILRHIEQLGPAALDAARYHQEKFDGSGYPFGLSGTEIPLVARIVAVADTYDAVTSSRSYRAALGHDAAIEIIRESSGSQLDPDLVTAFLKLVEEDEDWLNGIRQPHPAGPDG